MQSIKTLWQRLCHTVERITQRCGARVWRISNQEHTQETQKFSSPLKFLLWVAIVGLVCFSIIRFALYIRNTDIITSGADSSPEWILHAMFVGFRYDLVVTFYILFVPMLLLLAAHFLPHRVNKILVWISSVWISLLYSLSLILGISDIPHFEQLGNHISISTLNYVVNDVGQATTMVTGATENIVFAFIAICASLLFTLFVIHLTRTLHLTKSKPRHRWTTSIVIFVVCALLPLAVRGFAFQPKAMSARDAAISENNPQVNELTKNPTFNLVFSLRSLWDDIELINSKVAYSYMVNELGRGYTLNEYVAPKQTPWKNIVYIIEEGCTATRLRHEGNTDGFMPNLDKLITEGLYFENAYSTGTHTCNGIYSTIASMPSYIKINPMTTDANSNLDSIFAQLDSREDLATLFFITHDPHFDNVLGFVTMHNFDTFLGENNYGVKSNKAWGVDDHIMFDGALREIDRKWNEGKSFVAVCLTCSNHQPYNIPLNVGFTPTTDDEHGIAVQYADWAMQRFLDMAREREWFDQTLFVILGDHGRPITNDFPISESYVHIPVLFYSPGHIEPEVRSDLVSQMDITPTAMAMVGIEHNNHSFGIDLQRSKRRMIPYSSDNGYAARDENWVYIYNVDSEQSYLYDLHATEEEATHNVIANHPDIANQMRHYVECHIQAGWDIHSTYKSKSFETSNQ